MVPSLKRFIMTMSVQREALKEEYKILILAGGDCIAKDFQIKCIDLLEGLDVNSCFKFLPFGEISNAFLTKAKQENKVAKFENLEDVIKHLETYAQNLLTKPWCKDFYTINISNGFFKYKIEQWIPVEIACRVLEFIGYQLSDESPGIYKIEKLDVDRLILIGFELYLGHTQLFAFRSSRYLANYPLDQIMEARNETTGDPIKVIEWIKKNNILMERPCDISETLQETAMSKQVTTAFQHEHFNKNGQSTQEAVRYPPKETNLHAGFMEMEYPSLSSAEILDKELYGDETVSVVQDSSQKRSAATYSSYTRNPVADSAQQEFLSLPVSTASTKDWSSNSFMESMSDLRRSILHRNTRSGAMKEQLKNHSSKQASGQENAFAVPRGQSITVPDSSSEDDGLYVELRQPYNNNMGVPECTVEHLSGMANHEMTRSEKLGQTKDQRVDKILKDRIKAGEENMYMYQKPSTPNHCAESVVADASTMISEDQCFICGNISAIGCEKCEKIACQDCLRIMMKAPCISNENHKYHTLDNKDTLNNKDTGLSAVSQVSKTNGLQEQLAGVNSKKWQCKHCTSFNALEQTVCVICFHSKDFKEPEMTSGNWVCDQCTFTNPSDSNYCKICYEGKEKSSSTYV